MVCHCTWGYHGRIKHDIWNNGYDNKAALKTSRTMKTDDVTGHKFPKYGSMLSRTPGWSHPAALTASDLSSKRPNDAADAVKPQTKELLKRHLLTHLCLFLTSTLPDDYCHISDCQKPLTNNVLPEMWVKLMPTSRINLGSVARLH